MESMTAMTLCFMLTLLTFLIPDFKGADKHRIYRHEMDDSEHVQLLELINQVKGFVVLSGYESDVYLNLLKGWEIHKTQARISAHVGTSIKTECLWINPACQAALEGEKQQPDMFVQEGQCG